MDQDEYDALPTENEWVGQCVRYWRNHYGLQQADIAELMSDHLGVPWTQSVVANVEAGRRNIGLYELLALCIVFDANLSDFLFPEPADRTQSPTPESIKARDQQRYALTYALGEVLDKGWDYSTAEAWSFDWPRLVRPLDVIEARNDMLRDPEYRALLVRLYDQEKRAEGAEKLWKIVDDTYRHYLGGKRQKPYTATELVLALEAEGREALDVTPDQWESPAVRRSFRQEARRRAADLVARKVMGDL